MTKRLLCALLILSLALPCLGLSEENGLSGTAWYGKGYKIAYLLTFGDETYHLKWLRESGEVGMDNEYPYAYDAEKGEFVGDFPYTNVRGKTINSKLSFHASDDGKALVATGQLFNGAGYYGRVAFCSIDGMAGSIDLNALDALSGEASDALYQSMWYASAEENGQTVQKLLLFEYSSARVYTLKENAQDSFYSALGWAAYGDAVILYDRDRIYTLTRAGDRLEGEMDGESLSFRFLPDSPESLALVPNELNVSDYDESLSADAFIILPNSVWLAETEEGARTLLVLIENTAFYVAIDQRSVSAALLHSSYLSNIVILSADYPPADGDPCYYLTWTGSTVESDVTGTHLTFAPVHSDLAKQE